MEVIASSKRLKLFLRVSQLFREALKVMGGVCLAAMTLLTCADVVGRRLGHPIFGAVEIVGYMATLAVAFALPYTHKVKGHVGVEILVQTFSERTQAAFDFCTNLAALLFFALVSWRLLVYADTMQKSGEVSMNLQFPTYVIIYLCGVCFIIFCLTIIEDNIAAFRKMTGKK